MLLLSLLLTACQVCEWVSSKPFPQSFDDVWNTTYQVLSRRYDIASASRKEKEIQTSWRTDISILYLEGYRYKVTARIEEYEQPADDIGQPLQLEKETTGQQQKYQVKLCVLQEQNRSMERPGEALQASWYYAGNNLDEARLLLNFIAARLNTKPSATPDEESADKIFREAPEQPD